MTVERMKDLYSAQPFEPFTIHMADGRNLTVQHREFMSFSPSGRTVVVHTPEDRMHIVDLLLVASVEVGKTNGKPKRSGKHHG